MQAQRPSERTHSVATPGTAKTPQHSIFSAARRPAEPPVKAPSGGAAADAVAAHALLDHARRGTPMQHSHCSATPGTGCGRTQRPVTRGSRSRPCSARTTRPRQTPAPPRQVVRPHTQDDSVLPSARATPCPSSAQSMQKAVIAAADAGTEGSEGGSPPTYGVNAVVLPRRRPQHHYGKGRGGGVSTRNQTNLRT